MTTTDSIAECRRCKRVLLDPRSIAIGLGPGCARGLDTVQLDRLAVVAAGATRQLALDFGEAG